MAVTIPSVTLAEVKERANITVSTYDTAITNLIVLMEPGLQYGVDPVYSETTDTSLQKLLKEGILEQIAGETLCLKARGWTPEDSVSVGGISVSPSGAATHPDFKLGQELIQRGAARLRPYRRRVDPDLSDDSEITSTTSSEDRKMTMDTMEDW
ncbi:MAG TPA: hypothetical protein VMX94_10360 [Armatimonadota bacterium]|nr:hypothetical protein [Armatimonadota bacterium]